MIVLETALPIKFAETIEEALGHAPERPRSFAGIEALPKRVQVMPADVELVKAYIERTASNSLSEVRRPRVFESKMPLALVWISASSYK
jgi:hypothetical protein